MFVFFQVNICGWIVLPQSQTLGRIPWTLEERSHSLQLKICCLSPWKGFRAKAVQAKLQNNCSSQEIFMLRPVSIFSPSVRNSRHELN